MQLTTNFRLSEFACRCAERGLYKPGTRSEYCGGITIVQPSLPMMLQQLRDHFGVPITITSGYRCPAYNRRTGKRGVGGEEMSWHMQGYAADIYVPGVALAEVGRVAAEIGFRGVEIYPGRNFTHVDMRPGDMWRGTNFRRLINNA